MKEAFPLPVVIDPSQGAEGHARHRSDNRAAPFLTQLVVNSDADLRRVIGRVDVADTRLKAYGKTMSNHASTQHDQDARLLSEV